MSNGTMLSHLKNVKVELSSDMDHMIVMNTRITASNLDKILPSYETTLALSQPDMQPFLNIPCQVFPGLLQAVHFSSSESGKCLLHSTAGG
ncbi:hypothetical protein SOVF_078880 [Spinacia oleracea]|nr:hypothetical protein SOVF_078880 [Spinacia oleracea]